MTKAVDDDCPPRIRRSHEVSIGSLERASPPHCRALRCPPHRDGRRRTRADNWNGEPRSRACRPGDEGRRAAWRLYADRADRVRRDRFPEFNARSSSTGSAARLPWSRPLGLQESKAALADDKPAVAEQKPAVADEKPAAAEPNRPQWRRGRPMPNRSPLWWKRSRPPGNWKPWRRRKMQYPRSAKSRLKPRPYQNASTVRRSSAPRVPTAVPISGLMMRHLDPTGAMMDGAIRADRPGRLSPCAAAGRCGPIRWPWRVATPMQSYS